MVSSSRPLGMFLVAIRLGCLLIYMYGEMNTTGATRATAARVMTPIFLTAAIFTLRIVLDLI